MDIILAVLLSAVLIAIVFPQFIRSRPHFTMALAGVAGALLCAALSPLPVVGRAFQFAVGLLEFISFVLILCAAGGYRLKGFWHEISSSYRSL